jgi:hypothetical protein
MTKPGKAKASGEGPDTERDADGNDREDRDTVELDDGTLTRLRQFEGDASIADRDTVELSTAESLSLARHSDRSSPFATGEVPAAPAGAVLDPALATDGDPLDEYPHGDSTLVEEAAPITEHLAESAKSVRSLAEVEAEADRSAILTIPSPPAFEEET